MPNKAQPKNSKSIISTKKVGRSSVKAPPTSQIETLEEDCKGNAKLISNPDLNSKPSISRDFETNICREERKSFNAVIGCDEAGRGPLCGPVVAAAVWISSSVVIENGIHDSKATSEAQRELIFEILVKHPGVKHAVVRIEHDEIDKINILQASLKAMRLASVDVLNQLEVEDSKFSQNNALCLVDGNKVPSDMPVMTRSIIKGDSKVFSVAAASIIAKVSRDRIMKDFDREYPAYGFAQHKGYPTAAHRMILQKIGPSPIHRMSYRPVYESAKGKDANRTCQLNKDAVSAGRCMESTKVSKLPKKNKKMRKGVCSGIKLDPSTISPRVTRLSLRKRKLQIETNI